MAVGEPARPLVRGIEGLVKVMLQITDYVMRFAPVAVFAAVSATIAQRGLGVLGTTGGAATETIRASGSTISCCSRVSLNRCRNCS